MYHRYPKVMPRRMSKRSRTLLWVGLIALLILSVVLLFGYLQANRANDRTRTALINKVQNEASQASNRVGQLSQTSGSSTPGMVALVRQHIYSIRVLNELTSSIYGAGNILISEATLNQCVTFLDQCDYHLQSGTTMTQTLTALRDSITGLLGEANQLQ